MCLICIDLQKDKMTAIEARSNLNEIHETVSREHTMEILQVVTSQNIMSCVGVAVLLSSVQTMVSLFLQLTSPCLAKSKRLLEVSCIALFT